MRPTNTHIHARAKSRLSTFAIACLVLTLAKDLVVPATAIAASSFRPTLLVNTEAFLVIDDVDTTADIVMRFGDTLAKTLVFNRTRDRFEFNDDVYVTGTLQATSTISGAVVYGAKSLRSSGSLVWEGAASGATLKVSSALTVDGDVTIGTSISDTFTAFSNTTFMNAVRIGGDSSDAVDQHAGTWTFRNDTNHILDSGVNLSWDTDTLSIAGDTNSVGIGTTTPKAKLSVVGILSGVTIYATKSFSGAGLTDCDDATNSKLLWDATTGRFSCGTDQSGSTSYTAGQGLSLNGTSFSLAQTITGTLLEFQTVSGSTVYGSKSVRSSGSLVWEGTASGNHLHVMGNVGIGTGSPETRLEVGGTISGSNVYVSNTLQGPNSTIKAAGHFTPSVNGFFTFGSQSNEWWQSYVQTGFFSSGLSVGTTNQPKAKLDVVGVMSGVTIYATRSFSGAGLTDCDNATNSKLLWDATTGRFSCGTDQSGAGGLSLSDADARYVKKSGDTMTGVLAIQNGNTHTATATPLLNVRGTMSGVSLRISGSGANPLVTTDSTQPALRIGGSGMLLLGARSDPNTAPANTTAIFAQRIAGKTMPSARENSAGWAASPLQASLFGNLIMSITTGAGTTVNGYGTAVLNDTTVSHPAADQTYGYMTNFATAATSGDEAGTSSSNTAFFRGSTTGANGFFYYARVGTVDTTSIRVFSGMADQTIATMVGGDNPSGNHAGFQFSTNRGDSNWQFVTKDGTTQNVVNTGLAFSASKVYDLAFHCQKQCSTVTWEIRNVTDGTSATGVTSSNLPTTTAAMRIVLGVETLTTAAKNIRMQQLYVEADR